MLSNIYNQFIALFKQKFIKDTSWTLIATLIVGFSGLILQTLVGNKFDASGLGIYSQVVAIYTLFTLLAGFGIELSTIKHTAEYKGDKKSLKASFSTSQFILLLFSTITSTILYYISIKFPDLFSSKEVAEGIQFVCPGIVFFVLNRNSNSLLTGLRKMNIYALSRSLRWMMILVFSLIVILLYPKNINLLLLIYSLSEFLLFIFLLIITCRYYQFHFSKYWLKTHLNYGSKSILARLVRDFNHKLGILIVGYFTGNAATGIFSFIVTFAQAILIFSSAIQQNFNPFFATNFAKNRIGHIELSIKKLLKFTLTGAVPIYIFVVTGYYFYINLFLSADFHDTVLMFGILCIGIVTSFTLNWTVTMLPMAGLLNQNLVRILLGAVLHLLFLLIFTKLFSMQGAIVATSFSHIFNVVLSLYFTKRFLDIDVYALATQSVKELKFKK